MDRAVARANRAARVPFWAVSIACALVFAYAIFVLGWVSIRLLWGEQWWWMAALNTLPALLFVPVPVASVLALWARRPLVWLAAAVPICIWVALFGWRFLPRTQSAHEGSLQLRVMALNVLDENRDAPAIAAAVRSAKPDLVALAELTPDVDAALALQLGLDYPYRSLHILPGDQFGSGVYSRWPFDDLGSLEPKLGIRSAAAEVHAPSGDLRFLALHVSQRIPSIAAYSDIGNEVEVGVRRQNRQLEAICDYIDSWSGKPIILAGDFNFSEFSDAYRCLDRRMSDAYRQVGLGYGHTWPTPLTFYHMLHNPRWLPLVVRLDYVFYSGQWRALDARVLGADTGSDHRALLTTLEYLEQSPAR